MKYAITAVLLAVTFATAASAQTQEEQQACTDDAFRLCGHAIPDANAVAGCLSQNYSRVSGQCQAVMRRYANQRPGGQQRRQGGN